MENQIPPAIKTALDQAAQQYSRSPATTNAGRVLRFICGFLNTDTVIKIFAHKLG